MRVDEYIKAERDFNRVMSAVRLLGDADVIASLNRIEGILAEVRHYAVAVDDIRKTVEHKPEQMELISEADTRLLMYLAPTTI